MKKQPFALLFFLFIFVTTCNAEFSRLLSAYQAILAHPDNAALSNPGPFDDRVSEEIANATPAEIATITPIVLECLRSRNRTVRGDGVGVLFVIAARPDSAQLIDPYVDELIKWLDDPDSGIKSAAIYVLGKEYPSPSQKSFIALTAHLNDEKNTGAQVEMIAESLLVARPNDPAVIHLVLTSLAKYPNDHLEAGIIQTLGNLKITNTEALAFIRAGFANPSLRPTSIEAVGRMPEDVRDTFVPELRSTPADPAADAITRSAASAVLMQK